MPEALSTTPEPYRHQRNPGMAYSPIFMGWSSPPTSYDKWRDLITRWVEHSVGSLTLPRQAVSLIRVAW
jgi:xylan 1,4-beta-xylosidase